MKGIYIAIMGNLIGGGQLRLLCLHGYSTSEEVMEMQMNVFEPSFADFLSDLVTLRFVNAPFRMEPDEVTADIANAFGPMSDDRTYYRWWHDHQVGLLDREYPHDGMEESVAMLAKIWNEEGPFDGIIGFSQGAALASVIAMGVKMQDPRFAEFSGLRVLVSMSGWAVKGGPYAELFKSSAQSCAELPESPLPALAAYFSAGGLGKDRGRRNSEELLKIFAARKSSQEGDAGKDVVLQEWHAGGHLISRPTEQLRNLLLDVKAVKDAQVAKDSTRQCSRS